MKIMNIPSFLTTLPPAWLSSSSLKRQGIIIFGAGAGGVMLAEYFHSAGIPIHGFIDNFSSSKLCAGHSIHRLPGGPAGIGVSPDTPVVISTTNFGKYDKRDARACESDIRAVGWRKVAWRPSLLGAIFAENLARIATIESAFGDAKSRDQYRQSLHFLSTRQPEYEPELQPDPYFPADIPLGFGVLRWVQGGAFTGDTLRSAFASGIAIEAGAFFEPNMENYRQLVQQVQTLGVSASCWPCGLWDKPQTLRFRSGMGADSNLSSDGDSIIQCIDLDSALPSFQPTFITLDVEGAELSALRGMRQTIIRNRPVLAISIYHRPDDWWVIPEWLFALTRQEKLGYSFYLRIHHTEATDAILYAVPETW